MNQATVSAETLEKLFEKHNKRYLTMSQVAKGLTADERRRTGLGSRPESKAVKRVLIGVDGPYAVIKKGNKDYVIGAPLEDLAETHFQTKPGQTVGQAAQFLPITKPNLIAIANQLLDMGRLRAQISPKSEKVQLFWTEPKPQEAAAARSRLTESPASKPPPADPVAAFKSAYDDMAVGKRHVYVYELRRRLGWPRADFDQLLDRLMTEGRVGGYPGDPSRLSSDEVKDSFQGRDGDLYIAVAWRR